MTAEDAPPGGHERASGRPPPSRARGDRFQAAAGRDRVAPERLQAELRRTLAGTTARGAPFAVLGVVLVGLVVDVERAAPLFAAWAAFMLLLAAARTLYSLAALRRNLTDRRWYEPVAALLAGLTGLGWGGIPYLFQLPSSSMELVALTVIGCGVIITGALSTAPSRLTLAAYSLPVLLAQVAFNLEQSLLSQYWLGAAVATFFLFAWAMTDRYRSEILRRLSSQDAERAVLHRLERQAAETAALAERYRQEAERAEAASRAKSLFLANVSHEIRTPLNGVLGMAAALSQSRLEPRQRNMVGVIEQSGTELLHLIDDILDLSRIEAGKMAMQPRAFDLGSLLRNILVGYEDEARRKGLTLRLEIAPESEGRFFADPIRLRQVLQNLLSNAIKFTASGSITLRAGRSPAPDRDGPGRDGVEAGDPGSAGLEFEIADTGVGIPAHKQASIFDAFEQGDPSSTRRHGGTGLGLAICRHLVAMMGGAISVDSDAGQGATFRFRIVAPPAPEEARPAPGGAEPERLLVQGADGGHRPARVLAAEDSATNQMVLQALLSSSGAVLTMTADGEQLLAAWEAGWSAAETGAGEAADIILMDVHMPVRDGLDATRELRRREAESCRRRTPVIALTANIMAHQVADYVAAGMDATVAKPIDRKSLLTAMGGALSPSGGGASAAPCGAAAGRGA